ncbi:prolyl oligopeptidase family serine peptidase [Pedobacter sp. NJ-S-72]
MVVNPARSKWYHTYGYGNLRDYGLADKKAAIVQLADRNKFIDISRVGITGHSGGGFMSTAAMLGRYSGNGKRNRTNVQLLIKFILENPEK